MAIQVLEQLNPGGQLGSALGHGLQNLAQLKLQQIAQRQAQAQQQALQEQQRERTRSGLSSLFGPELAQSYSQLPESILGPVIKQKLSEPSQQAYAQALQGLLGGQMPELSGLTGEQARQLAQLSLQKQQTEEARKLREATELSKAESQRQKSIIAQNKPYINTLSKGISLADQMETIASELLALENSGTLSNIGSMLPSPIYNLVPASLLSPETQRYEALSNELASLLASQSGTATNFKIKLAQSMKPNLGQKPEARRALIQDILNKSHKIKLYDQAKDYLIEKHGNKEPKNLEGEVKKLVALYDKLPSADEFKEGTVLEDKGNKVKLTNGTWQFLAGE